MTKLQSCLSGIFLATILFNLNRLWEALDRFRWRSTPLTLHSSCTRTEFTTLSGAAAVALTTAFWWLDMETLAKTTGSSRTVGARNGILIYELFKFCCVFIIKFF